MDTSTVSVAVGGAQVLVLVGVFFRLGSLGEALTALSRRVSRLEGEPE